MLKQLGRIVPRQETSIKDWSLLFLNKVTYTKIEKQKTIYTLFLDEWISFYEAFTELKPKFTGADGKSLKGISRYFKEECWQLLPFLPSFSYGIQYIQRKLA